MARNKNETHFDESLPDVNAELLAEDNAAATALAVHQTQIMESVGDGQPYDRIRVIGEFRFLIDHAADAMLEAGRRLILLKENEPHGEFTNILEHNLKLSARTARVMMQAAARFLGPKLIEKRQTFAVLGKAKLFELMSEDDGELAELAEGGTVAGLSLDDIDTMSVREVRAALRESREQSKAKDRLLATKNEQLDKLATGIAKAAPVTRAWSAKVAPFKAEISAHFDVMEESAGRLALVHDRILSGDFGEEEDPDGADKALRTCAVLFGDRLRRLAQQVAELQGAYESTLGGWGADLDGQVLRVDPAADNGEQAE